jgi:hypothetical protein
MIRKHYLHFMGTGTRSARRNRVIIKLLADREASVARYLDMLYIK